MLLAAARDGAVCVERVAPLVAEALKRAVQGQGLTLRQIELLLEARGPDLGAVCVTAELLRQRLVGPGVSYVVCRNINYTNRCAYACSFCAFSKGSMQVSLRLLQVYASSSTRLPKQMRAYVRRERIVCRLR